MCLSVLELGKTPTLVMQSKSTDMSILRELLVEFNRQYYVKIQDRDFIGFVAALM